MPLLPHRTIRAAQATRDTNSSDAPPVAGSCTLDNEYPVGGDQAGSHTRRTPAAHASSSAMLSSQPEMSGGGGDMGVNTAQAMPASSSNDKGSSSADTSGSCTTSPFLANAVMDTESTLGGDKDANNSDSKQQSSVTDAPASSGANNGSWNAAEKSSPAPRSSVAPPLPATSGGDKAGHGRFNVNMISGGFDSHVALDMTVLTSRYVGIMMMTFQGPGVMPQPAQGP